MAYVRVQEWTPVQVAEWFQGLDDRLRPYVSTFLNNSIDGRRLMMLAPDDLINLQINKLGHQELILEMVEQLRYSYFHLNDENLQWLDLRLSCKAHSLHNDLQSQKRNAELKDGKKQDQVATATLSAVADLLTSVKVLVSWLDRPPFSHQTDHVEMRKELLKLSVDLATISQRDKFAEQPNDAIQDIAHRISQMCDKLLQESNDPLIVQPVSLEVATIKKKANEELGIHIQTLYSGIHIIGRVKAKSPAFNCRRIEAGDEIVQVNCQTVVAWPLKRLVSAMKEDPTEVVLTLKKRPKHSTPFGRMLSHHFFIVSKKMTPKIQRKKSCSKLNGIAPTIQTSQPCPMIVNPVTNLVETTTEDEDDDAAFLSEVVDSQMSTTDDHLDIPKLHVALQRRATITGASPTSERPPVRMDELWQEAKRDQLMRSMSHDITAAGFHAQLKRQAAPPSPRDFSLLEDMEILRDKKSDLLAPRTPRSPCRPVTCIGGGKASTETRVKGQQAMLQEHRIKEEQLQLSRSREAVLIKTNEKQNEINQNVAPDPELANFLQVPRQFPDLIPSCYDSQSITHYATSQNVGLEDDRLINQGNTIAHIAAKDLAKEDCSNVKHETVLAKDIPREVEDEEIYKSYQVVVIGGVPQKHPKQDSKKSPATSPVHRRKRKIKEIASRRISCKDLGHGDCQGWLYRGCITKKLLHHFKWTKRWCVLKESGLYIYKDEISSKAECFIILNGFNCSPATECKSRKYSFKLYHSGTAFYFASDSQMDMAKWMNKMGLAAIDYDTQSSTGTGGVFTHNQQLQQRSKETKENVYYSETDEESEEVTSPESVHSAKTAPLCHSPSSSSLSSSSSYYSPMESLHSSAFDSGSSTKSPKPQRDGHGSSSDSFGEIRQEEKLKRQHPICSELRVNASNAYAVSSHPASPHYSSIHLQTIKSEPREGVVFNFCEANNPYVEHDLECIEAVNPCFMPHLHNHAGLPDGQTPSCPPSPYAFRAGTLPALSSSRRDPPARLTKGTSLEWKSHSEGGAGSLGSLVGAGSELAKMSLAFEMNLDSSPPKDEDLSGVPTRRRHSSASSQTSQDSMRSFKMSALRLFGSPKFVRKFKGHGGKKAGKGPMDGGAASTWYNEPAPPSAAVEAKPSKPETASERRFLGSPKLARALYRAIHHSSKKAPISEGPGNPLVARRLSDTPRPMVDPLNYKMLQEIRISSIPSHSDDSLNAKNEDSAFVLPVRPSARSAGLKVDVSAAASTESGSESMPGTPRTPLKPAMGVSMIGKQRRASSQSESTVQPRNSHQHHAGVATMASQATQTDNRKAVVVDELALMAKTLHAADLHLDGSRVSTRRRKSAFQPHWDLRYSKKVLRLRALNRTLTAKERDLEAIEDLLASKITSQALKEWKKNFPYILQPNDFN